MDPQETVPASTSKQRAGSARTPASSVHRLMDQQLLKACNEGDLNLLKQLSDPDILLSVTPFSNNCLHIAAMLGYGEFAKEVWSRAPSLFSSTNNKGETPLMSAVMAADSSLASDMITAALQLYLYTDGYKHELEQSNMLREILLKVDNSGDGVLHHTIRNGLPDLALRLLSIEPRLSELVNSNLESPMYMAARRGYIEVVDKLLAIPSSTHGGPSNETVMCAAVKNHNTDLIKLLLEKRPKLAYETHEDGHTPLLLAVLTNNLELVKLFLDYDPNLGYLQDAKVGQTPFYMAANIGSVHIAKVIMSTCPDSVYTANDSGYNALHSAIAQQHPEFVDYLLGTPQLHRLINQADNDHNLPLHFAAHGCYAEFLRSLLSHESKDHTALNAQGNDAFDVVMLNTVLRKTLKWNESFTLLVNAIKSGLSKFGRHRARIEIKKQAIQEVKELTERYTTNTSLVAALLVTITFAAAFTLPGGYSNDASDTGLPVFASKVAFQVFLISDTIAMCSSLAAAFLCILVAWEDLDVLLHYRKTTRALMWCAYASTAVAFGSGLFTVMAPKSMWLAILILLLSSMLPFISKIFSDWPLIMLHYRLGRQFDSKLIPNI